MTTSYLRPLKADAKRILRNALLFGALLISTSLSFAQNEFAGDGGPLYITAPCTDEENCSPVCGTRQQITVVDNDPNAGTISIQANGGQIFEAVADGNNPGTFTNTVPLKILSNNTIYSWDSDTLEGGGNWDVIEVGLTSPAWTFDNPNILPCQQDPNDGLYKTGVYFLIHATCLAPGRVYYGWETVTVNPDSCAYRSISYKKQTDGWETNPCGSDGTLTIADTIQDLCPLVDNPCVIIDSKYWNIEDEITGETLSAPSEDVEIDEAPSHLYGKIQISDSQVPGSPFTAP